MKNIFVKIELPPKFKEEIISSELIKMIAACTGDRIAVRFNNYEISYTSLMEIIHRLGDGLSNLGVQRGDRVAIMLPNFPHFIFSYYASMFIGGISIPLNPLLSREEIKDVVQSTQPTTLIIWDGFFDRICDLVKEFKHIVVLGENLPAYAKSLTQIIADGSFQRSEIDLDEDETALIQYTAGVVSAPKPVELTHRNIAEAAKILMRAYPVEESDVFACLLPLSSPYSQNLVMNFALAKGARFILYPKFNLDILRKAVFEDGISFLVGGPGMFQLLLSDQTDAKTSTLKYALSVGSACHADLLGAFEDRFGIPLLEVYGMTETSGIISCNGPNHGKKKGSAGLPVFGVDVKIVDENGERLEAGEIAEIAVRGKVVMKGYWGHPVAEEGTFRDGWFHTNDLGRLDEDGFLHFIDRREDLINKGGFHIYSSEIEKILKDHPKVDQISIIGLPHPTHKYEVKACVVLKKDQQATAEELIDFCKAHSPVYKCPQIVQFYDALPRSATGKVLKRKLREEIKSKL